MTQKSLSIAIIGGGISGLYFAHLCQKEGLPFTLYEKEDRIGGAIETDQGDHGFCELGAHTLYNSYENTLSLIKELGLETLIIPKTKKKYKFYENEQFHSLLKRISFSELIVTLLKKPFKTIKVDSNIKEKYTSIFGKKNYKNLFHPFFNALLNQEANDFPGELVMKKRTKNKKVPRSFTLLNGLQTLVNALQDSFSNNIKTSFHLLNIKRNHDIYNLENGKSKETYNHSHLVFSTPISTTLNYLNQIEDNPCQVANIFQTSHSKAISVQFPSMESKFAGAITKDMPFRSFIFGTTENESAKQQLATFHLKEPETASSNTLNQIQTALEVPPTHEIKVRKTKTNVMPRLNSSNWKEIKFLTFNMIKNKSIFLIGNSFQGVSIEDCLSKAGSEFDRLKNCLDDVKHSKNF